MMLAQEVYSILIKQPDDTVAVILEWLKKKESRNSMIRDKGAEIDWEKYTTTGVDIREGMSPEYYVRSFRDCDR